jgi:hypothetical protein
MYWRATVERPDGEGGWVTVGVFGTKATPGNTSARYLHGDTALAAAQLLLSHVWPIDLTEFNKRDDVGKWRFYRDAKKGIAGHRVTVEVSEEHRWSVDYGKPVPPPLTITVAELRLAAIRERAAELVAARAELKELTEKLAKARANVRYHKSLTTGAQEEAEAAGVDQVEITRAARPPRQRRSAARRG